MIPRYFFLLLLVTFAVHGHVINYNFHENKGPEVNACVEAAISKLMQDTCLTFNRNSNAENSIFFIESGSCGWQSSNLTVHLNSDCIKVENCTQFLHHALSDETHHPSVVNRHINLKYNCTDKCTIFCENGGIVTPQCTCKCGYGFTGNNCEKLKHNGLYTDTSCGVVDIDTGYSQGTVSLRQPAESDTFCQWIIKSTDPWTTFELEFEDLDLDSENLAPGQTCGDQLSVYGLKNFVNPVACDNSKNPLVGESFRSESNIVFIDYRGNRLASETHKGPTIRYKTIRSHPTHGNRPFKPLQFSAAPSAYKCHFMLWPIFGLFLILFVL
ncbi:protein SpAN-like [Ditylenchus destructor]|uniref:Protein SpAN-like n=1 Tax=Ditylenchus destructor TaxID=166010 RepID=A0AAD4NM46_9BILA|nr:protein SpAN-like [Ditylenchus destructor]